MSFGIDTHLNINLYLKLSIIHTHKHTYICASFLVNSTSTWISKINLFYFRLLKTKGILLTLGSNFRWTLFYSDLIMVYSFSLTLWIMILANILTSLKPLYEFQNLVLIQYFDLIFVNNKNLFIFSFIEYGDLIVVKLSVIRWSDVCIYS